MRPALLAAYAAMLPRLQAEEELGLVNAVAGGSGTLKKDALRRYLNGLQRQARPKRRARARSTAELEAAGITVERVPKRD